MKIYLTDISSRCCPEFQLSPADAAMTERVKARVFEELGISPRRSRASIKRITILVAAMISLFVSSAFAVSRYFMSFEDVPDEGVSGYWTILDKNGEILESQKIIMPDAGILFSFTGPDEEARKPEFRCFWLPSKPDVGTTDEEGWCSYLCNSGSGPDIPFIINCGRVSSSGSQYVLNGKVSVISEEYWGDWYVIKLHSDYRECTLHWGYDEANYIFLFNEQNGALLTVSGTDDMDTLEHIARELEIRSSDEFMPDNSRNSNIGQLDVGRG